MENNKYYAERNNLITRGKYDLKMLTRLFLNLYRKLDHECYFQESFGYYCVDGSVIGSLGTDIEADIYLQTGLKNVWPIYEYIDYYSEAELFTMIEFLFNNVSAPTNKYYHEWDQCGYHATKFNREKGVERYIQEINKIFDDYEKTYFLSKEGEVRTTVNLGHEKLVNEELPSGDFVNVDERISYAISKFFHFKSGLKEKKDAVRTLGDVLEFYKKQGIQLNKKDDSDLFNIMNGFDIRHHNKNQTGDYDKEIWYEWIFYTFLSSIRVLQKLNDIV